MRRSLRWFARGSARVTVPWVGWWIGGSSNAEMEREKKKFNLSSLLRIYLRKKSKGLHCHSCRPPPAAGTATEPAPLPGGDWTVKLSQIICISIAAGGLWSAFYKQHLHKQRNRSWLAQMWLVFVWWLLGKKGFWFAGFLLSNKIPSAEARFVPERSSKPNKKLVSFFGLLLNADIVLYVPLWEKDQCND